MSDRCYVCGVQTFEQHLQEDRHGWSCRDVVSCDKRAHRSRFWNAVAALKRSG